MLVGIEPVLPSSGAGSVLEPNTFVWAVFIRVTGFYHTSPALEEHRTRVLIRDPTHTHIVFVYTSIDLGQLFSRKHVSNGFCLCA